MVRNLHFERYNGIIFFTYYYHFEAGIAFERGHHILCSPLSPKYQRELLGKLKKHNKIIQMEFFDLCNDTEVAIADKDISMSALRSHVSRFLSVNLSASQGSALSDELKDVTDFHDFFRILITRKYINILRYEMLESIVETFHLDLKDKLEKYKGTYKNYMKSRVCETIFFKKEIFQPPIDMSDNEYEGSLACEETLILVTHDIWSPESYLGDVDDIILKISEILRIPFHTLKLQKIESNCLTIYLSIPSCLKENITTLNLEKISRLICSGIVKEQCGELVNDLEDMCKCK